MSTQDPRLDELSSADRQGSPLADDIDSETWMRSTMSLRQMAGIGQTRRGHP